MHIPYSALISWNCNFADSCLQLKFLLNKFRSSALVWCALGNFRRRCYIHKNRSPTKVLYGKIDKCTPEMRTPPALTSLCTGRPARLHRKVWNYTWNEDSFVITSLCMVPVTQRSVKIKPETKTPMCHYIHGPGYTEKCKKSQLKWGHPCTSLSTVPATVKMEHFRAKPSVRCCNALAKPGC